MANNSFVEFFWISSIVSKRRPFKVDFNLENRKKSAGAKSGEQDGWGTTVVLFFTRKLQFLTDVKTVCFLVLGQHTGHEFCGDALHVEFFCRNCLAWSKADAYIFSNLSDSRTAVLENQMTNASMWTSFVDVEGRPIWESSSIHVLRVLKRLYHSKHCVRLIHSSPKVCWSIFHVSVAGFPSLKQNFTHTRCSSKSSIFTT